MKARMMIVFLMVMSMATMGQTTSDQQQVIELSLHMAEMNPNDHLHGGTTPYLVIVDNGVLPQGLSVSYFGVPVVFKSTQQIASEQISNYIKFDAFAVTSATEANATLTYHFGTNQGRFYQLGFGFLADMWYINQKHIADI
jgi:hypothetical protein